MKRSRYVALFGMGTTALLLAACEDPESVVPVKAYDSVEACIGDGFSQSQCRSAHTAAVDAYDTTYAKYGSEAECEVDAGNGRCEADFPNSRNASWRPSMIGFLMGTAAGTRVQPQAVVANAASPSGRATAAGFAIAGNGVNSTVPAKATYAPTASQVARTQTVSRGGFGSTSARLSGGHTSSGG
ncbi:MAG: DUF1190 domain-containing protein [Hyphomicrobiaceae bacterium]